MTVFGTDRLYLSRLFLDPRSRQVWSELARPYEMHKTLMRAFPETTDTAKARVREKFGVLFRADVDDRNNRVIVYVQSAIEPNWSFLSTLQDYLLVDAGPPNPAWKNIMDAFQGLQKGQVLSFCLRANPTKRIAKVAKGYSELMGKRVGLLREEEQIAWLIRKGPERKKGIPGGFEILMNEVEDRNGKIKQIPRVNVRLEGKQKGFKKEEGCRHETTHLAVRFDGLLRITETNAFRETLAKGIGSGKAFGFGLLSVAPRRASLVSEAT
jgi:CRISPR system Cascade subunit CasE